MKKFILMSRDKKMQEQGKSMHNLFKTSALLKILENFAIIIFVVIIAVGAVVIHYTVANKAAVDCTSTSSQNSGDKVPTTTTTTNTPTNTGTYGTLTNPASHAWI
ncbi:uncharacterized protein LOC144748334 [Ciona intestinalis]